MAQNYKGKVEKSFSVCLWSLENISMIEKNFGERKEFLRSNRRERNLSKRTALGADERWKFPGESYLRFLPKLLFEYPNSSRSTYVVGHQNIHVHPHILPGAQLWPFRCPSQDLLRHSHCMLHLCDQPGNKRNHETRRKPQGKLAKYVKLNTNRACGGGRARRCRRHDCEYLSGYLLPTSGPRSD